VTTMTACEGSTVGARARLSSARSGSDPRAAGFAAERGGDGVLVGGRQRRRRRRCRRRPLWLSEGEAQVLAVLSGSSPFGDAGLCAAERALFNRLGHYLRTFRP